MNKNTTTCAHSQCLVNSDIEYSRECKYLPNIFGNDTEYNELSPRLWCIFGFE
jgi:hypothetical protein